MRPVALCALLYALCLLTACNMAPIFLDPDIVPWPEPVTDTCETPEEITQPPFVIGYMEITEELLTDPVFIVGTQSFVLLQEQIDSLGSFLDAALEAQWPAYDFKVYVNDSDYRRIAVIVDGTNDRQQFYLTCQVRYNGLKHYFGWATQSFLFGGAVEAYEMPDIVSAYPSVDHFNFRATEYDSVQYDHIARAILGECKAGRYWADFRWGGPWDPALIQAFEDAGWGFVTEIADPDHQTHAFVSGEDSRSMRAVMLGLADNGWQVIIKNP